MIGESKMYLNTVLVKAIHMTTRQQEAYEFITRYFAIHRRTPLIAELQRALGLHSSSSVDFLLKGLEKEGYISRRFKTKRGIELLNKSTTQSHLCEIPVFGKIAAGKPIVTFSLTEQTTLVPPYMIGKGETFGLIVTGDSMIEMSILDGDLIVIESSQSAQNGQIVVALIDDEVTLKRFYRDRGRIRLEPANCEHRTIIIKPSMRFKIQGIFRGLIRKAPNNQ
jgi:repressor LexA